MQCMENCFHMVRSKLIPVISRIAETAIFADGHYFFGFGNSCGTDQGEFFKPFLVFANITLFKMQFSYVVCPDHVI